VIFLYRSFAPHKIVLSFNEFYKVRSGYLRASAIVYSPLTASSGVMGLSFFKETRSIFLYGQDHGHFFTRGWLTLKVSFSLNRLGLFLDPTVVV
jgi:hypothetical protein